MNYHRVFNLFFFLLKSFLMKLKTAIPSLVILFFLVGSVLFLGKNSYSPYPTILLCNEDDSFIGKLLIKGILDEKLDEVIRLKEVKFSDGLKEVKTGEADCLLHIKENTVNTLYEGERVSLDLYFGKTKDSLIHFAKSYIGGFIDIINTSQNAGLAYMDLLSENGKNYEDLQKEFQKLQLSYSGKVLSKDEIFFQYGKKRTEIYKKMIFPGVIFFLLVVSFFASFTVEYRKKNMKERLHLSGYSGFEIGISIVLFFWALNFLAMIGIFFLLKYLGAG